MPKLATGLTVKQLDAAKPKTTLSDGRGLSLVVDANGNKRWVFRYTRPDGRRNWLGLGSYPDTSLLMARSVAQEARERLSNGEDPAEIKKNSKRAEKAVARGTFKAIAEEWYTHKAKSWASETARKARESLDDDLFPKLGARPIAEITSADIKPVILFVHERAPRLAVKARQYCNQIIEYAIQEGLREDGRLLSLRGALPRAPKGHYAAVTKSNDLPALINAINAIGSLQSRAAILFCLYTALRPGVAVGARWDEFDLNAMEWHIPASRMKMGNDHITPIPSQMLPLLERQREITDDSPFVFPGVRNPKNQHMHRDSLSKILRESGLRGVTVTHGFRATLRTIAREKFRVDADVLEAQLAHAKKDEIQAAYDRTQFLEERHNLVQDWADYLDKIKAGAEVTPDNLSTLSVSVNGLNGKEASTQVIPPPVNNPTESMSVKSERPSMAQSFADSRDKVKEFRMNSEKGGAKETLPPANNPDELTPQPERISMAQSFADGTDALKRMVQKKAWIG